MKRTASWLKIFGLLALLLPFGFLFVLGIGEMTSGIVSGSQHFVQALPILALGYLAWKKPNAGGKIIIAIASLLTLFYLIYPPVGFALQFRIFNAIVLFGPALLAGILFWRAST